MLLRRLRKGFALLVAWLLAGYALPASALSPLAFDLDISSVAFAEEVLGAARNNLVLGTGAGRPLRATLTVRDDTGLAAGAPFYLHFTLSDLARFADFTLVGAEVNEETELDMAALAVSALVFQEADGDGATVSLDFSGAAPTSADGSVTWVVYPATAGADADNLALEAGDTFTFSLGGVWHLGLLGYTHEQVSLAAELRPATGEEIVMDGAVLDYAPATNLPRQLQEAELLRVAKRFALSLRTRMDNRRFPVDYDPVVNNGRQRTELSLNAAAIAEVSLEAVPGVHDRSGEHEFALVAEDMVRLVVDGIWGDEVGSFVGVDFDNDNRVEDESEAIVRGALSSGSITLSATATGERSFTNGPRRLNYRWSEVTFVDGELVYDPPSLDYRVKLELDFADEAKVDQQVVLLHAIHRIREESRFGSFIWKYLGSIHLVPNCMDGRALEFHLRPDDLTVERNTLGFILFGQSGDFLGNYIVGGELGTREPYHQQSSVLHEDWGFGDFAVCDPDSTWEGFARVMVYALHHRSDSPGWRMWSSLQTPAGEMPWLAPGGALRKEDQPLKGCPLCRPLFPGLSQPFETGTN